MKDKELKLNASGYYDEPCYKTMTAPPKPGEIWTHTPTGHHMLIVASLNGVCSTLRLTETEREGCIPVTGRTLMFTTPIMLGYSFESTLGQYVKSIKGEEFEKVKKAIVKTLGLHDVKAADMLEEHTTRDTLQAEYDELLEENKALQAENERCAYKVQTLDEQRNKLLEEIAGYGETIKRQSDELNACNKENVILCKDLQAATIGAEKNKLYKELYEALMDKVMKLAMRGGSTNE